MPQMYESRAQGGPLDGIRLMSPLTWKGQVQKKITDGYRYYHQGRYHWHPIEQQWQWRPQEVKRELTRSPKGKANSRRVFTPISE